MGTVTPDCIGSDTVFINFEAPQDDPEGATLGFWQAVEASGIPHQDVDPEDFGTTMITITWDRVLEIEAIAAEHHGLIGKWA